MHKTTKLSSSEIKLKEASLHEINLDKEAIDKNLEAVSSVRFLLTIFTGILSGILNLTGFSGIIFYIIIFLISTPLLFIHIKRQRGSFSENILSLLFAGFFKNGMIFTIFWVMFYNLVHIYK